MKWEFFIPLVSFLGLVVGIILAKVSPEEMKPGKKSFQAMRILTLFLLIAALLYYSGLNLYLLAIGLALGLFVRLGYLYLGAALAGALMMSRESLLIVSSLVFIYGMPYGSLLESQKKITLQKLLSFALVFAIPFLLLLSQLKPGHILSLAAGLLAGMAREDC